MISSSIYIKVFDLNQLVFDLDQLMHETRDLQHRANSKNVAMTYSWSICVSICYMRAERGVSVLSAPVWVSLETHKFLWEEQRTYLMLQH